MKKIQICINQEKLDLNKKLEQLYHQGMMNKDKYNEIKNSSNIQEQLNEYYYFITLKQVIISLVIFISTLLITIFLFTTVISSMSKASEYNEICEVSSEYTEGIDCNKSFATDSDIKTLKTLVSNEIEMPLSNSDYEEEIDHVKSDYRKVIGYSDEDIEKKYSTIKTENLEKTYNSFNNQYNTDLETEQRKLDKLVTKAKELKLDVSVSKDDTLKDKQTKYKTAVDKEEKRLAAEKKAKEDAKAKADEDAQVKVEAEANEQANVTKTVDQSTNNSNTSSNALNDTDATKETEKPEPEVNNDYCYPTYDDAYNAGLNVFLNGSFIDSNAIGKFEVNSSNCPIFYGTDGTYDINGNKI